MIYYFNICHICDLLNYRFVKLIIPCLCCFFNNRTISTKIPVLLLKARGFVSDISCNLYILPMTCLEVMHIRNKVQEFICTRFINRQIGEFNGCHCAKRFINHDAKIVINSTAANNVNKIPVLLTKTQCLQGFFYVLRVKKDLAELLLQGLNLIFNFALWLINGFTH